jgi:hypothetical protein
MTAPASKQVVRRSGKILDHEALSADLDLKPIRKAVAELLGSLRKSS